MNIKVTIGVITYKSATFIKETLDSCLLQLNNDFEIELFVSDDASQDGSKEIISAWMEEHGNKFCSHTFVAQPENLGGRNNSNFVLNNAQGEYIRTLEGDDILVPRAVSKLVEYVDSDPKINFVFSNLYVFYDDINQVSLERATNSNFVCANAKKQHEMLFISMKANGPTTFYNRQLLIDIGGRVGTRNIGDLPTMLNITAHGYKLYCYEEPLLYYRRHSGNISSSKTNPKEWKKQRYEMKKFRNEMFFGPHLSFMLRIYCVYDLLKAKKSQEKLSFLEQMKLLCMRPIFTFYKKVKFG